MKPESSETNDNTSVDYKIFVLITILVISGSLYYGYTQMEILHDIIPPATTIVLILALVGLSWYLLGRRKNK